MSIQRQFARTEGTVAARISLILRIFADPRESAQSARSALQPVPNRLGAAQLIAIALL
jgi:hypothetical protein